jgi:hypothetical protein
MEKTIKENTTMKADKIVWRSVATYHAGENT